MLTVLPSSFLKAVGDVNLTTLFVNDGHLSILSGYDLNFYSAEHVKFICTMFDISIDGYYSLEAALKDAGFPMPAIDGSTHSILSMNRQNGLSNFFFDGNSIGSTHKFYHIKKITLPASESNGMRETPLYVVILESEEVSCEGTLSPLDANALTDLRTKALIENTDLVKVLPHFYGQIINSGV